jgi:hypothetical protein
MESPFDSVNSSVVAIYLEPVLNPFYRCYQDILTVSNMPAGPLAQMVARIGVPKLSEFQSASAFSPPPTARSAYSRTCLFALCRYPVNQVHPNPNQKRGDAYMYASDVPNVFGYLESNGYRIMEHLTEITRNGFGEASPVEFRGRRRLVCVFKYEGGDKN